MNYVFINSRLTSQSITKASQVNFSTSLIKLLLRTNPVKYVSQPGILGMTSHPFYRTYAGRKLGIGVKSDAGFSFFKNILQPSSNSMKNKEILATLQADKADKNVQNSILKAYISGLHEGSNSSSKKKTAAYYLTVLAFIGVLAYLTNSLYKRVYEKIISGDNIMLKDRGDSSVSHEVNTGVKFSDVIGCDEVKKELEVVVDFLKNPEKYTNIGARLPRGVLLEGAPGVGKTLLAKAVAGEANVSFLSTSGSQFDEIFVGVGSKRLRELFAKARKIAPCVIFIDEIDAVGGSRSSSPHYPYANQTINQLLSEMDGFNNSDKIIVLGATNKAELLDKALLRPGRFDFKINIMSPDNQGRKELFNYYISSILKGHDIDVDKLALMTVGCTGADIKTIVNSAAIMAAEESCKLVSMSYFHRALDKIRLGLSGRNIKNDTEKYLTALHEAGHAIVCFFLEDYDMKIDKITILPRGRSGGHNSFVHKEDKNFFTRLQCIQKMAVGFGGLLAEEMYRGKDHVSQGPSHDLGVITDVAKDMVLKLGMSDKLGNRLFRDTDDQVLSDKTKELIDDEIATFIEEGRKLSRSLIEKHQTELLLLVDALLKYETLSLEDLSYVFKKQVPLSKRQPSEGGPKKPDIAPSRNSIVDFIPGFKSNDSR